MEIACVEKSFRYEPDGTNMALKGWHSDARFFAKTIKGL